MLAKDLKPVLHLCSTQRSFYGTSSYAGSPDSLGLVAAARVYRSITLVAFATNSDAPEVSKDQSGEVPSIQLEHLGMWFSSLQDYTTAYL
ncbi:MAG TPA: hypothetical protein VGN34_34255 [Ktedonobacteraceae bacterium]